MATKKETKKSLMQTMKKSLKFGRSKKTSKSAHATPTHQDILPIEFPDDNLLIDGSGLSNASGTPRKHTPSIMSFNHSNRSSSVSTHNYSTYPSSQPNGGKVRKTTDSNNTLSGLGVNHRPSTMKLKSSGKYTLPFNVPQLYINKNPDMLKNVVYDQNEFSHYLTNEDGVVDKVIIPITIDIESVYNMEFDNNYNRKVLGPLKPVRFPIVCQCIPDEDILYEEDTGYGHIELDYDSDLPFSSDEDIEDLEKDLLNAKPITITSAVTTDENKPKRRKHAKSRSIPVAPPAYLLTDRSNAASKTMMSPQLSDDHKSEPSRKKEELPPAPHVNLKRKDLVRKAQAKELKQKQLNGKQKSMSPKPAKRVSISYKASTPKQTSTPKPSRAKRPSGKRRRVRVHKQSLHQSEPRKSISEPIPLKFENKYEQITMITPDELEILARKLVNVKDNDDEDMNSIGFGGKHGRRNSFNYIHPRNKIKKGQHNHLLQSNVSKKSENVQFGLQLINSIRQITSSLTSLMCTFSEGLNDLLRICQQFIELIIDPLPKQVYNEYEERIDQYQSLVKVIDMMSNRFFDSSQNLQDDIPGLTNVLQSDISHRVHEFNQYTNDFKSADNDLRSLQVHCDRTLRRLFREIPKPMAMNNDNGNKVKKDHKRIRTFGAHYVAANSNEHICRAVPSKIRSGIVNNYIHYLTLMDTMNDNIKNCYENVLPKMNVEFEESQTMLKEQIALSLESVDKNVSCFFDANKKKNKTNYNAKFHRYNQNKPQLQYAKRPSTFRESIIANKPYEIQTNNLMASPMHVKTIIAKIDDYVSEEHEKKTYDEFESVRVQKKTFKDQRKQEHGTFSLNNYRLKFDSDSFINNEVIQNFFNNHYYHLGDILFEIPDLYEAFENYLKIKLSSENLYFLREIDDIYFNLDQSNANNSCYIFDHSVAVQESRNIFSKFISEDSDQQINLPGDVYKKINKDLKKIEKFKDPISIFDKAYDCISSLIHKESLPNFYKSQHFKNWYEKQRAENEKIFKKERKKMAKNQS